MAKIQKNQKNQKSKKIKENRPLPPAFFPEIAKIQKNKKKNKQTLPTSFLFGDGQDFKKSNK